MAKLKYFAGDYLITTKDGSRHIFNLTASEIKALYQKFMWIKIFKIKSVEPTINSNKPHLV